VTLFYRLPLEVLYSGAKMEKLRNEEVLFGNKKAEPSLPLPFLVDKRI
jgi:hypothetical protein